MRKLTAIFLMLVLVLSISAPAMATGTQPTYSTAANSGVRHQVCTSLEGTSVGSYYTGDHTFDTLSAMQGDALLQTLRTLMKSTHHTSTSYDQCRDLAVKTDCENGDGETINLIYTSYSVTMADYINNATDGGGWNREHVWPKSLGGFNQSGAGSDLHHIRPSDKSVNGKRGNEKYGIPTNGQPVTGTVTVDNSVGGYSNNTYFEPLDNVKGDVARICLYVYVRYGGELSKCSQITNVFQSVEVLLQWHAADPVDTWEMGRNEVVYGIQGNRNVFIDYPELAWLLFEQEVPAGITTPSGNKTATPDPDPCTHENTTVTGAVEATCGTDGYTGDTYCADCSALVTAGQAVAATGAHTFGDWVTEGDVQTRTCSGCSLEQTQEVGSCTHEFGEWEVTIEPSYTKPGVQLRECKNCGYVERQNLDILTCSHLRTELQNKQDAGCKDGYTGDSYCVDCETVVTKGQVIPATGEHLFGAWVTNGDYRWRVCSQCNLRQEEPMEVPVDRTIIVIVVAVVIVGGIAAYGVYNFKQEAKKKAEAKAKFNQKKK